ncbi:hypothetical protein [Collimonas fungivorans]|uniref:hypothetical protein n=1 Tax=Collimonas fungivorans TaxID=158899 RepID=UPI003FA35447
MEAHVGYGFDLSSPISGRVMERYAEVGISIELNTSSNVYIGQISSRADHPIFRRVPLNDKDLNDIGKYNQVDLRKRCLSVTTNKISSFVVEPQKISAYLSFRLIFCGKTAAKLLILVFSSFTFRATLRLPVNTYSYAKILEALQWLRLLQLSPSLDSARGRKVSRAFFRLSAWIKPAVVMGQSCRCHVRRVGYEVLI